MKRFKKESLLLAVAVLIAIAGLTQLFHEEAYATPMCYSGCECLPMCYGATDPDKSCNPSESCAPCSQKCYHESHPNILCGEWCSASK